MLVVVLVLCSQKGIMERSVIMLILIAAFIGTLDKALPYFGGVRGICPPLAHLVHSPMEVFCKLEFCEALSYTY